MNEKPPLLYERGDLTAEALRTEVETFFAVASDDPAVQQDAAEAGVNLDELLAPGPDQIRVEPADAGMTGFEEAVVIMLLTPVVESAWQDVVLPWLRRRFNRPVGEKASPQK
jgi:hypothetical protein